MAARGLRNRTSRLSSPALAADRDRDEQSKSQGSSGQDEGTKTFMDRWVEPSVRTAVPSYADTKGLEGFGVLENLAPLGQPPTQKLIQKLKLGPSRLSVRSTPAPSEEVVTPATELASPVGTEMPTEMQTEPMEVVAEAAVGRTPERGRPKRQDYRRSTSQQVDMTPSPIKTPFPPSTTTSPMSTLPASMSSGEQARAGLNAAIRLAKQQGVLNLVPGLETLREDALSDPHLCTVLQAISHNAPSRKDFKKFKQYIKSGIRRYNTNPSATNESISVSPSHSNFTTSPHVNYTSPRGGQAGVFDRPTPHLAPPIDLKPLPSPLQHRPSPSHKQSSSSAAMMDPAPPAMINGDTGHTHESSLTSPARPRSGSVSSSSSLSSAKSFAEDFPATQIEARPVRASGQRQGASRVAAGNKTRSSAVLPPSSTATHPLAGAHTTNKFAASKLKKQKYEPGVDQEAIERRRQELLQQSVQDYDRYARTDSHERSPMRSPSRQPLSSETHVPAPVVHAHPLLPSQGVLSSPLAAQFSTLDVPVLNGSRKRSYHDIDAEDTGVQTPRSTSPGFLGPPPPPGAAVSSRAATPRAAKQPVHHKARKSARVMISPNKPKNGGITAGFARAGPPRDGAMANGTDSNAEDNDEICASCGGEGTLLCCDGCPNSFHHTCLEPPLNPDKEVEGDFFCPRCVSRRTRHPPQTTGLFGRLVHRVDDVIPKAFTLPYDIRDYFEGVKTGDDGEYEEVGLPRTQHNAVKLNRAGFVDEPNYKELRDNKGNLIVCYKCGLTSHGRDIIPCDYCSNKWHLDCLDPPLAVPPRRRLGDKPSASWRCPLHVEHDLIGLGRAADAAPGDLGRFPRVRKPKHARPFDVSLSRGFKNNGIIEVDLLGDDESDIKEVDMNGQIFRLPENSIRLDFIDRVKRSWYEDKTFPMQLRKPEHIREHLYRPDLSWHLDAQPSEAGAREANDRRFAIEATARANAKLRQKSVREQQAVLRLADMSAQDTPVSGDKLVDLTNRLVAEAPDEVLRAFERDETEVLKTLQALVQQRLTMLQSSTQTNGTVQKVNGERAEEEDVDMIS